MERNRIFDVKGPVAPDVQQILSQAAKDNVAINKLFERYGYSQRVKTVFMQQQQPEQEITR